ncbi:MAG: hypothetical protein WB581_06195 [Halobacteriota archaeon]
MRYQKEKQNRLRSEKAATNEHELNVLALLGMGKQGMSYGRIAAEQDATAIHSYGESPNISLITAFWMATSAARSWEVCGS